MLVHAVQQAPAGRGGGQVVQILVLAAQDHRAGDIVVEVEIAQPLQHLRDEGVVVLPCHITQNSRFDSSFTIRSWFMKYAFR